MPHRIAFLKDNGVVVLRLSGDILLPEVESALSEIPSQPWFHAHLKMIVDTRACTTAMTGKDVQAIASCARALDPVWGETKWAVLAPKDLIFGLVRIYIAITSDFEVQTRVFRTSSEATDWLGAGVDIDEALGPAS